MTGSSPTNDEIEFTAVIRRGDIYDARIIGFGKSNPYISMLNNLFSNQEMV